MWGELTSAGGSWRPLRFLAPEGGALMSWDGDILTQARELQRAICSNGWGWPLARQQSKLPQKQVSENFYSPVSSLSPGVSTLGKLETAVSEMAKKSRSNKEEKGRRSLFLLWAEVCPPKFICCSLSAQYLRM